MWFSEDQRANTIKTHVEKRLDYVFKFLITTLLSIKNTIGRTHVTNGKKLTNMHL